MLPKSYPPTATSSEESGHCIPLGEGEQQGGGWQTCHSLPRPLPPPTLPEPPCWPFPQSPQALLSFQFLELRAAKNLGPTVKAPPHPHPQVGGPLALAPPGALDVPASLVDLGFPLLCYFGTCCPHCFSLRGGILHTSGIVTLCWKPPWAPIPP